MPYSKNNWNCFRYNKLSFAIKKIIIIIILYERSYEKKKIIIILMWRSYEKPKYSADLQRKDLAPCRNRNKVRQFRQQHHKNQHYCKHWIYRKLSVYSQHGPTPINACFLLPSQWVWEVAPCACLLVGPVSLPRVPSFIVPTSHIPYIFPLGVISRGTKGRVLKAFNLVVLSE